MDCCCLLSMQGEEADSRSGMVEAAGTLQQPSSWSTHAPVQPLVVAWSVSICMTNVSCWVACAAMPTNWACRQVQGERTELWVSRGII